MAWRVVLAAISLLNVSVWLYVAWTVVRRASANGGLQPPHRWQLALSALFVFGCAFRSVVPRADVQRIVLYDTWISSVMVGRSVATAAELAFVAQWALALREIATAARAEIVAAISRLMVPLIVVAEMFSWYAVLTTNYLGNALEESTWTLTAALMVSSCIILWPRAKAAGRRFLGTSIVVGGAYFIFMCLVDVPMYLARWRLDQGLGRRYLTFAEGLRDAATRWTVTHQWHDWRDEIPWMTLYFSVGVWTSLAMVLLAWA